MNRRSFLSSLAAAVAALLMPWKAKPQGLPRGEVRVLLMYTRPSPQPAGYFYANYTPVVRPPKVIDFSEFRPEGQQILTRYGKELLVEGAQYYKKVNIFTLEMPEEQVRQRITELVNS